MFNQAPALRLTIPTPFLAPDLNRIQREYMGCVVSLEEIVTMVLFIEYFCLEHEREFIRADYTTSLMSRFNQYNSTLRDTDEEYVQHLLNLGTRIPFNLELFAKGYRSVEMKSYIDRSRRKFQNHYLFICENIDRFYNAVATFYRESPNHHTTLTNLASQYLGFMPKVTRNEDLSLNLVLIKGSII